MNLHETRKLAEQLMAKHQLNYSGWRFEFDSARRRAGVCKHRKKVIGLSKYLLPHMKEDKVKDTLLHEIAHALVGPKHGHDWVWRNKAIEIGCNGARCYDPKEDFHAGAVDELATQSKYYLYCETCGKKTPIHRKPKREKACGACCNKHSFGRYDERFKLTLIQNY